MSFTPPPANQLVNFVAQSRKSSLIASGYFSPNDSVAFIWTPATGGSGAGTPVTLTGTIDGSNLVFTSPVSVVNGIVVFRNGIYQQPTVAYNVSASTVTFTGGANNTPEPGDVLMALVS